MKYIDESEVYGEEREPWYWKAVIWLCIVSVAWFLSGVIIYWIKI